MAHFRRAVGAALVLNTSVCAVEMAAGVQAHSLSLLTDSIHNCSDAAEVPHGGTSST